MKTVRMRSHLLWVSVWLGSCIPGQQMGQDLSKLDESGSHQQPSQASSPEPALPQTTQTNQGYSSQAPEKSDRQTSACALQYLSKTPSELESKKKEELLLNTKFSRDQKGDASFESLTNPAAAKNRASAFPPLLSGLFWQNHPIVVLFLWSPDCKFCVEEAKKISAFAQSLTQLRGVRVAFISETPNFTPIFSSIENWKNFVKKPTFPLPKGVFQGAVRDDPSCIQLTDDTERPMLVVLTQRILSESHMEISAKTKKPKKVTTDKVEFVVRQTLKPPFTQARLEAFRSGVKNLFQPLPRFAWPPAPKKEASEQEKEMADRSLETKLLHQKLSSLLGKPIKLAPGPLFYVVRFNSSLSPDSKAQGEEVRLIRSEVEDKLKSLFPPKVLSSNPTCTFEPREINSVLTKGNVSGTSLSSTGQQIGCLSLNYSSNFVPYGGAPMTLFVDTQKGIIREALVGPILNRGRFLQAISEGLQKLIHVLPERVILPSASPKEKIP